MCDGYLPFGLIFAHGVLIFTEVKLSTSFMMLTRSDSCPSVLECSFLSMVISKKVPKEQSLRTWCISCLVNLLAFSGKGLCE